MTDQPTDSLPLFSLSLIVQLAGYEVQYQMFKFLDFYHPRDNMDTAASNIAGAAAAVVVACCLSSLIDELGYYYNATLLQRPLPKFGRFLYQIQAVCVKIQNMVGLGRKSDLAFLEMEVRSAASILRLVLMMRIRLLSSGAFHSQPALATELGKTPSTVARTARRDSSSQQD